MSDPRHPEGYDPNRPYWSAPTEQLRGQYPPVDPAYSGPYGYPGYSPPPGPEPTQVLPPYWTQTQYPPSPPPQQPAPEPPEPPKSPRWLWLVAGLAVTLVIGLVIALVIANGSARDDTAVAPLPPMPAPSATAAPPTTPTTTPTPTTATTTAPRSTPPTASSGPPTTTSTDAAATETVVYRVTGEGRAISITYVDTGGMLQMEFNVVLPWTREVALSPQRAKAASVTVINVGREVGCSITVNGSQTQERTGTGLTICSSMGN